MLKRLAIRSLDSDSPSLHESGVEKMWNQWRAAVFLSFLLQMCSAVFVLDCKPSRNGNGMLYNILNLSDPLEAMCDYWWDNGNIMLATNNNKTALVMRHNSSSLEMSECLADVTWTQQCSQMPGLMDFSANCSTTCASKNSVHGDGPTTNPTDEEKQSNTITGAVIGIAVAIVVIGLIGLTIFLLYKYIPDRIPRILHCSLIGRAYRAVKRENNEPGTFNVESGGF